MKSKQNPRVTANILSALTMTYMIPIFVKAFKKCLLEKDLFEALDEHKAGKLGEKLEKVWFGEFKKHKKFGLHIALFKCFGFTSMVIGVCRTCAEIMLICILPHYLGKLLNFFNSPRTAESFREAFISTGIIIISQLINCFVIRPSVMGMQHHAMKLRVACSSMIYRKSLRLSQAVFEKTSVGQIVNLMSNDVTKFDNEFVFCHYAWIAPIQCILGTYMIYEEMGFAGILGISFLLLAIAIEFYLGKVIGRLRARIAEATDERVRLMNEFITGIQVIKMYAWEKEFANLVTSVREKEMRSVKTKSLIAGLVYSVFTFLPRTCILITLITYHYMGGAISAAKVFTLILMYNVLKPTISNLFYFGVSGISEVDISIRRIQSFLAFEEFQTPRGEVNEGMILETGLYKPLIQRRMEPTIQLVNVSAKWYHSKEEDSLKGVNLSVENGQHVALIGPVGSGKSSLMNVILRELPAYQGAVQVEGRISYSAQDHWLFSGSIKQNILFAENYEEGRYKKIVNMCALEVDFSQFPHGDRTLVGEKGRALSGGQKARINLARCLYKEADVYLLDDPLSAVDATVGKQLYEKCIAGHLKGKICVLATHQLQYLQGADKIILMDEGRKIAEGTYDDLRRINSDFTQLSGKFDMEGKERKKEKETLEIREDHVEDLAKPFDEGERIEEGGVRSRLYWLYFRAGGNAFVIAMLLLSFILSQISANGNDFYVTYWVNVEDRNFTQTDSYGNTKEYTYSRKDIILIYVTITVILIILCTSHLIFFYLFIVRASKVLHNILFKNILDASIRFFDTNPSGNILNRFSRDLNCVDETLPKFILDVVEILLLLLGAVALLSVINPWFLIPSLVLMLVMYLFRCVYLRTNRSVKRIEAATRSPMFSLVVSTIQGITTIRALNGQNALIQEFHHRQDLHSSAWFLFIASKQAFSFWTDIVCWIFSMIVTLASMLLVDEESLGGDIGLVITQSLSICGILQWGIGQWSEMEIQMISVERMIEYNKIEKEPKRESTTLPDSWPQNGVIEFKNLSLKYKPEDPYVLKNLNFTIRSREKVGVCGRTGAGKTSLITALFQLYETEGAIVVDGVDITKIPLEVLRSKMCVIPQEPLLFSGTIRKNLDPFDEYPDEELWKCLKQVEMMDVIGDKTVGLEKVISEGGRNFSVGQRQLFCLARAILRRTKILLLDEATANVDPHTDILIQRTIRKQFSECTVITIAHRLHTVMDSDRILFMDDGANVEFDSPEVLLRKENGFLAGLVRSAGVRDEGRFEQDDRKSW